MSFSRWDCLSDLGRNKVCAVLEPDVELPTDLEGIMPITYVKGGAWKYEVAREIKEALQL